MLTNSPAFYNITTPTKAAPGNELGIFEDLNDKYSQTDLNLFFLTLAPYAFPCPSDVPHRSSH